MTDRCSRRVLETRPLVVLTTTEQTIPPARVVPDQCCLLAAIDIELNEFVYWIKGLSTRLLYMSKTIGEVKVW